MQIWHSKSSMKDSLVLAILRGLRDSQEIEAVLTAGVFLLASQNPLPGIAMLLGSELILAYTNWMQRSLEEALNSTIREEHPSIDHRWHAADTVGTALLASQVCTAADLPRIGPP
jgi:hypothetical protein